MQNNFLVEAKNIDKSFPGVYALKKVDFSLKKGSVHALLGENGAGKSTFIKILGGIYQSDGGELFIEGKKVDINNPAEAISKGISIIHQELNLADNLSIAENIFFGRLPSKSFGVVDRKTLYNKADELLKKVGLNIGADTKVRFLSIAQQQLIEILKAISLDAKILVMDEPTSSLSPGEIEVLFNIIRELKANGIGIIYVSHKLDEIFDVCDMVTILRDGEKIKDLEVRNTNSQELISLMVGRELKSDYKREGSCITEKEEVLNVRGFSNWKLKDINFSVKKGEILGFSGLMGAGKTEIARALFGLDPLFKGEMSVGNERMEKITPQCCKKNGIGYVPEDRKSEGLFLSLGVNTNMSISTLEQYSNIGIVSKRNERKKVHEQINALKIKTPSQIQKVSNLSGGNQQKVILSRWLLSDNLKVLIIDEPTRGIDVGAKFEIYNILSSLADRGLAIIIMSSEIEELLYICDRIAVLREGRITAELDRSEACQENIMKFAVL
ncbi:MAG: sugar ABC transporter ATP-binding protein [Acetivibrionales bacterium]|jgi:ribose transport system ATP-binding protein